MPIIKNVSSRAGKNYRVKILADSHTGGTGTLYFFATKEQAEAKDSSKATASWAWSCREFEASIEIMAEGAGWLMAYQRENQAWCDEPYAIIKVTS